MTRYFYASSRAHHAYSMAVDFGMRFKKRNGVWLTEGLPHLRGTNYRIEVAEESLPLLEPQVGDVLYTAIRQGGVSIEEVMSEERQSQAPYLIGRGARIIQRNGIPFQWPEQEP